jgi:hypothetical protein
VKPLANLILIDLCLRKFDLQVRPIDGRYKLSQAQAYALRTQSVHSVKTPESSSEPSGTMEKQSSKEKGKGQKSAASKAPSESEHPMTTQSKARASGASKFVPCVY